MNLEEPRYPEVVAENASLHRLMERAMLEFAGETGDPDQNHWSLDYLVLRHNKTNKSTN